MDPALKHRLIGAAVLSAVLVIFLPKLLVSHDTRSTAADVPLKMPNAPGGDFQTKELPLVTPASDVPQNGVVGMDTSHPTPPAASSSSAAPNPNAAPASGASSAKPGAQVAITLPTTTAPAGNTAPVVVIPATAATAHAAAPATTPPITAANAGGRYVVSLGTYSNAANAQSLVASLKNAQLPAYAEPVTVAGKSETRVRIGPYPQRGDAEAARLKAQQVRKDMSAVVTALDAAAPAPEVPATPAVAPPSKPTAMPAKPATAAANPASKPAAGAMDISAAAAKPASPAAAGRGYVVQLVAFKSQEEALGLRDKLRAAGYTAFSEKVVTESATLYRVRIGPEADREGADRLRAEVSAKFGLNGIVVAYP